MKEDNVYEDSRVGFFCCVAVIDQLVSLFGMRVHSSGFLNQSVIKPTERWKTNQL